MTEDQVLHDDDDDLNLDDEFILEDWDEDDDEILVIADNLALEADDLVIDESEIDLIDASGLEDDDEVALVLDADELFGEASETDAEPAEEPVIEEPVSEEPVSEDAASEEPAAETIGEEHSLGLETSEDWGLHLDDWNTPTLEDQPAAELTTDDEVETADVPWVTETQRLAGMLGSDQPEPAADEQRPTDIESIAHSEEDDRFSGSSVDRPDTFEGVELKVFSEQSGEQQGAGWNDLDLENVVDSMSDQAAAELENVELDVQDSAEFDLLDDGQEELILIDDEGFEQTMELEAFADEDDRLDDLEELVDLDLLPVLDESEAEEELAEEELAEEDYDDFDEEELAEEDYDDFDEEDESPEIDYSHTDFELSDDVDPEWAPVEQVDEDADEYDASDEDHEDEDGEYDEEYEEPDYSEYEEAYYEDAEHPNSVGVIKRGPWRRVAGIAAAFAFLSLPAVYFLKPEWLNLRTELAVIEVLQVERPTSSVVMEVPSLGEEPELTDPKSTDLAGTDPAGTGVAKTDPATSNPTSDPSGKSPAGSEVATADPVDKDPVGTEPTSTDPGQTNPSQSPVAADVPVVEKPPLAALDPKLDNSTGSQVAAIGAGPSAADTIPLDEEGLSYLSGQSDGDIMEAHRKTLVKNENGLVMGSQVLAQLLNDNIFVGTVKALNSNFVTLRTKTGEITLARDGLRTLTTLAASEALEWQKTATTGYVILRNSNRLKGKIVETREDAVILQVNSNRVVVPLSQIETVTEGGNESLVQMRESIQIEHEKWFRKLVESGIERKKDSRDKVRISTSARPEK